MHITGGNSRPLVTTIVGRIIIACTSVYLIVMLCWWRPTALALVRLPSHDAGLATASQLLRATYVRRLTQIQSLDSSPQ